MRHTNRKTTQLSLRLSVELYNDLQKLKRSLKVTEDSEALRFCIIYTIASISQLDEKTISEALSEAIIKTLFDK